MMSQTVLSKLCNDEAHFYGSNDDTCVPTLVAHHLRLNYIQAELIKRKCLVYNIPSESEDF